jgi:hypothetical protein
MRMPKGVCFSLRHLGVAVASVIGSIVGVLPVVDAHPAAAVDQAEVATDRKILQDRIERIRAALSDKSSRTDLRGHFAQWYNWNDWNNGWNNWRNW